jgi:hypothetical protein
MQRFALFVLYRFEGRCCFCPSFKNSRFRSVKPALQRGTGFQREFLTPFRKREEFGAMHRRYYSALAAELPLAGVRVAAHPVQTCRKARPRTTVAHNLMYLH